MFKPNFELSEAASIDSASIGVRGACARFTPRTFGMIAAHINAESPLDRETTTSTANSPIVRGSSR